MALGGSGNINNLSGTGNLSNLSGQTPMGNFFSCEALAACDVIVNIQQSITAFENAGYQTIGGTNGQVQFNDNGTLNGLPMVYLDGNLVTTIDADKTIVFDVNFDGKSSEYYQDKDGLYFYASQGSASAYMDLFSDTINLRCRLSGDEKTLSVAHDGITASWLSGAGNRMVVADAIGKLSTQAIPTVDFSNVAITGGTINGTPIGATNPNTVRATEITNTSLGNSHLVYSVNGLMAGNSNLIYDYNNHRFGLGVTPSVRFQIQGSGTQAQAATNFMLTNSAGTVQTVLQANDAGYVRLGGAPVDGILLDIDRSWTTATTLLRIRNINNTYFLMGNQGGVTFQYTRSPVSGNELPFIINHTFAPTSGTAAYSGINLISNINQSGGANGITRGMLIQPVFGAGGAANFIGIEIDLASTTHKAIVVAGANSISQLACKTNFGAAVTPTALVDINGATGYTQIRMRASYTPVNGADPLGGIGVMTYDNNNLYLKIGSGWRVIPHTALP